jgi:hypothetical protein
MHTIPNLPDSIARETYAALCDFLPPPVDGNQEARAARLDAGMEAVAALHPSDAFEARLAAQIVGAQGHARECLREASFYRNDFAASQKCRNQAALMMRHVESGVRMLERRQAAHDKAIKEAHPAAMGRAGYWFKESEMPQPVAAPAPEPAEPPKRDFYTLTRAEQYGVMYPDRAAGIRAAGGIPADCDYGPPEADLVEEILASTSPILLALDNPVRSAAE